jgi:hypothetical protein
MSMVRAAPLYYFKIKMVFARIYREEFVMGKTISDDLHRLTGRMENPREGYDGLVTDLLGLITEAEVMAIKHRNSRRHSRISDKNIKDIYMAKNLMHEVLLLLGWDDEE